MKLDRWEDAQIEKMREVGNIKAKKKYEQRVPAFYRRPKENDPQYVELSVQLFITISDIEINFKN